MNIASKHVRMKGGGEVREHLNPPYAARGFRHMIEVIRHIGAFCNRWQA